jgi:hypothetical protein
MAFKEDIMKELGITSETMIPKVTGTYRVAPGKLEVHPNDMPTFQALFAAGTNKGVGNGEVSLFWLFNWGQRSNRAVETRGGNDPDLLIDNQNVEVKAYGNHDKFSLGRFQNQKVFREMVSIIFSVDNIMREKGFTDVANFKFKDLSRSAETFCEIRHMLMSDSNLAKYKIFQQLISKIERFEQLASANGMKSACYIGQQKRPGGALIAMEMSKYILKELLGDKPGDKGYMLNLVPDASKKKMNTTQGIMLYKVDLDKMETAPEVLGSESPQTFTFNGGAFSANFRKLFGKITTP